MSSTFVSDTTEDTSQEDNTVIIIVNDDTGNIISVDQEMLQQLLSMKTTQKLPRYSQLIT